MNTLTTSTTEQFEGFLAPPPVTPTLLKYLRQVFPDRLPEEALTISDRQLGALVGKQMVIRHLEAILLQQEEEHLMITDNVL